MLVVVVYCFFIYIVNKIGFCILYDFIWRVWIYLSINNFVSFKRIYFFIFLFGVGCCGIFQMDNYDVYKFKNELMDY